MDKDNIVVEGTTCFAEHQKRNLTCSKTSCRQWMDCKGSLNCAIVGATQGEHTLQQIGDIFDVTRMRVCQIEKSILTDLTAVKSLKRSH